VKQCKRLRSAKNVEQKSIMISRWYVNLPKMESMKITQKLSLKIIVDYAREQQKVAWYFLIGN
jgi:hypothetical protein